MLARRSAATVTVAEWQHQAGCAGFLGAARPCLDQFLGRGLVSIPVEYMRKHLRTIDPSPQEIVVRERISVVVGPHDLLGRKVGNPASAHDLG